MSKKKRRYENHKKRHQTSSGNYDIHHCCFIRRAWNHGYARAIRQFHYCTIPLPKATLHKAIHDGMKEVPVPSDVVAKSAYEQLLLLDKYGSLHDDDPIEKRLAVLVALFDCAAQETADGFRKQLSIVQSYKNKPP